MEMATLRARLWLALKLTPPAAVASMTFVAFKYRPRSSLDVDFHEKLVRGRPRSSVAAPLGQPTLPALLARPHPTQMGNDRVPSNAIERALLYAARTCTIFLFCE